MPNDKQLFEELKKLSKRANQRLVRLERRFSKKDSWAAKKLRDRLDIKSLDAWTGSGRIKANKSMTEIQMKATIKAVNQFLNSATSTKTGIDRVRKTTISSIAKSMSIDEKKLSYDEAETLYNMLSDDYTKDVLRYIPASEFWAIIEDAKENNDTVNDFLKRISDYIEFGNDEDMRNKLIAIYHKYVV